MTRELVVWDPFRSFTGLDRAFDRFFGEWPRPSAWSPAVDIEESDDSILLRADLPGVDPKEVTIEVKDNVLTLRGERKLGSDDSKENNAKGFRRVERSYGSFTRSFTLPRSVDSENVTASYRHGVLAVTLPKRAEAKPRQIDVKIA